jgi:hypothetical protein
MFYSSFLPFLLLSVCLPCLFCTLHCVFRLFSQSCSSFFSHHEFILPLMFSSLLPPSLFIYFSIFLWHTASSNYALFQGATLPVIVENVGHLSISGLISKILPRDLPNNKQECHLLHCNVWCTNMNMELCSGFVAMDPALLCGWRSFLRFFITRDSSRI